MKRVLLSFAVVPGYYLVCYNSPAASASSFSAVVPGYYLVCYNMEIYIALFLHAVVPGYYLVCYNGNGKPCRIPVIMQGFIFQKTSKK